MMASVLNTRTRRRNALPDIYEGLSNDKIRQLQEMSERKPTEDNERFVDEDSIDHCNSIRAEHHEMTDSEDDNNMDCKEMFCSDRQCRRYHQRRSAIDYSSSSPPVDGLLERPSRSNS